MPVNKSIKQVAMKSDSTELRPFGAEPRRQVRKAPGTRAGTLQDWREGSNKISPKRRNALRDGR
jgi:hypothetical protein